MRSNANDNQTRRRVLKTAGAVAVGTALAGCSSGNTDGGSDGGDSNGGSSGGNSNGGDTATATPEPVSFDATMGIIETELNQIPSLNALLNMLPEATDDRLSGSYRTFRSSSLPMQAMVGGEVDYYALSMGNVFQGHLAGNDLVTLGPKVTGTDYQMVIRSDIEASSLEELVNGDYTIGVAGLGGLSHMQVAGVLKQEGLTTDVEKAGIQSIGGSGTRTAAINSGKIDATSIHIDQVQRLKSENAKIEVLFDFREYFPNFVSQAITVTQDFLDSPEGQAHVQNYMDVYLEANDLATNNFDWLHKRAQQVMASPLEKEDARKSWKFNADTINAWQYTKEGFNDEDFKKYADALVAAGVLSQEQYDKIDFDELLVHDYWDEAASDRQTDRWL